MRTTITLEDDVTIAIERIRAEEHTTFRQTLNNIVREGLAARTRRMRQGAAPIRTTPASNLGPRFANLDNTSELLAIIEGDTYK